MTNVEGRMKNWGILSILLNEQLN